MRDLHQIAIDTQIAQMAGFTPNESLIQTKLMLELFILKDNGWAIYHKVDRCVIGFIGLNPDTKRAKGIDSYALGYSLHRDYWGQGLMSEAGRAVMKFVFKEMKVNVLAVYHYTDNQLSQRVVEKLGFIYEGTIRGSAKLYNGQIKDEMCYSLTKDEYEIDDDVCLHGNW